MINHRLTPGHFRTFRMFFCAALMTGIACLASPTHAGGPENVLLVVNVNSPDSLAVANHYIHLRGIPRNHVVYLDGITQQQIWEVEPFKEKVLERIVEVIDDRGIGPQIDYVVYSAGFPTAIVTTAHGDLLKSKVRNFNPQVFRSRASINSLTYFLGDVLQDNPVYMGLDSNWYMRQTVMDFLKKAFVGDVQKTYADAIGSYETGDYATSSRKLGQLVEQNPGQVASRYYLVRSLAREGKTEESLTHLQLCIQAGWCYRGFTQNDAELSSLTGNPRFAKLLEDMPDYVYGQLPTRGFNSRNLWARNGSVNRQNGQGKRFVLSTVLAVTNDRGTNLDEALSQLERSVSADGTHPRGTFYFADTANVRSKARKNQFPLAIKELKELGFGAQQIKVDLPEDKKNVLGATLGHHTVDWQGSGSQFVPGAICDNLTSYGGVMHPSGSQTPLTDFIREGAGGASGTVIEPLAIANKFPSARLHVHYARGCTLAEAFYQSVSGPYQLLIVGDPLCKPWANSPRFNVSGINDRQTVRDDFQLTMEVDGDSPPVSRFEIFVDGRMGAVVPAGKPVQMKISELSDGYHELRVVAVDATLVATKSSQRIDFFVNRNDKTVRMELAGKGVYNIDRTLSISAKANCGNRIDLFQNSRKIGSINGRNGELRVDCKTLGQGHSTLQAVVIDGDQEIASMPASFQIVR